MPLWKRKPLPVAARLTPADPGIEDTAEARELEHTARHREALRLIRTALATEAAREPKLRNTEVVNLCLDLTSALTPEPIGSRIIKELPARPAVPVIPGRAS